MKTYLFIEKNGSGILYLSAENDDKAFVILNDIVKDPDAWRFDWVNEIN